MTKLKPIAVLLGASLLCSLGCSERSVQTGPVSPAAQETSDRSGGHTGRREDGRPAAATPNALPTLSYGWEVGETYAYEFSVISTRDGQAERLEGSIVYRPQAPEESRYTISEGTGTAFVVSPQGYLVTCEHCIRRATEVVVELNGDSYPAKVVAADRGSDLALLRISPDAGPLSSVTVGDSTEVELAEEVRVIGYPLADVLGQGIKVTRGSIAGLVDEKAGGVFQVDAAVNAGNSGGPIVDDRGQVIGVASSKLSGSEVSNVAFAIPASDLVALLRRERISVAQQQRSKSLTGPEIAREVTPAVALIKVTTGPNGFGCEDDVDLEFDARLSTDSSASPIENELDRVFGMLAEIDSRIGGRIGARSRTSPGHEQGRLQTDVYGEVEPFASDLQLPYLLGPLGTLILEPLGGPGKSHWHRHRTVALYQKKSEPPASPFGFPGRRIPFSPFAAAPQTTLVAVGQATELASYEIAEVGPETIRIDKQLRIVAAMNDGLRGSQLTGKGTVVFDRQKQVPAEMKLQAEIQSTGDTASEMSVEVSFKRVEHPTHPQTSPPAQLTIELDPDMPELKPLFDDDEFGISEFRQKFSERSKALEELKATDPVAKAYLFEYITNVRRKQKAAVESQTMKDTGDDAIWDLEFPKLESEVAFAQWLASLNPVATAHHTELRSSSATSSPEVAYKEVQFRCAGSDAAFVLRYTRADGWRVDGGSALRALKQLLKK